ncbi:MAG: ATP-binding protein [Bacteroidota bacterium]
MENINLYEVALDLSPTAMILVKTQTTNSNLSILKVNKALQTLLDLDNYTDTLIWLNKNILHKLSLGKFQDNNAIIHVLAKPKYTIQFKIENATDSVMLITAQSKPTKEKEVIYKLKKDYEALDEKFKAFTSSIFHDLKAPVRIISGYSNIILEDFEKEINPQIKEHLQAIIKHSNKLKTYIEALHLYAFVQRKTLEIVEVDMREIFQENYEKLKAAFAHSQKISFTLSQLPTIKGDLKLLSIAVEQLISNALKFTQFAKKAEIKILYEQDNDFISYKIVDNGIGLKGDLVEQSFTMFHKLHSEKEYEGIGAGLAITQAIITKHRGKIQVTNNKQGCTTLFLLPLN